MDELDELRLKVAKVRRWKAVEKDGTFYILHPDVNILVTAGYPTEMGAWYDAFARDAILNWPCSWAAAGVLLEEMNASGDGFVTLYAGVRPSDPTKELWVMEFGMRERFIKKHKTGQFVGVGATAQEAITRCYLSWKETANA